LVLGTALGMFCSWAASASSAQELASAREELRRARSQLDCKSDALTLAFSSLDPVEAKLLQADSRVRRALGG
jgi:hypothetical protein